MRNKLLILGAGAVLLVGAGAAVAHGRGGHGFMKWAMEKRVSEAEDYVSATPEQRKVIEGSRDAIEAKMKAHFEARRAAHEASAQKGPPADPHDLVRMLAADKIDEKALYAEIDARAEEMKAMARELVPEVIKAHDALTPAQRQKLASRVEARHAERREHWEHERGGFGGPDQQ